MLWEAVNGILPSLMRKISVTNISRLSAPGNPIAPGVRRTGMYSTECEPGGSRDGVLGIIGLACSTGRQHRARTREINYGTD